MSDAKTIDLIDINAQAVVIHKARQKEVRHQKTILIESLIAKALLELKKLDYPYATLYIYEARDKGRFFTKKHTMHQCLAWYMSASYNAGSFWLTSEAEIIHKIENNGKAVIDYSSVDTSVADGYISKLQEFIKKITE